MLGAKRAISCRAAVLLMIAWPGRLEAERFVRDVNGWRECLPEVQGRRDMQQGRRHCGLQGDRPQGWSICNAMGCKIAAFDPFVTERRITSTVQLDELMRVQTS